MATARKAAAKPVTKATAKATHKIQLSGVGAKPTPQKKTKATFKMIEDLGKVGNYQLRYGSWNGGEPKYDLRSKYKGITLTGEELIALADLVDTLR